MLSHSSRAVALLAIAGSGVESLAPNGQVRRQPAYPASVIACEEPSLRELVQRDRLIRRSGIGAGVVLLATTAAIGSSAGVVDSGALFPLVLVGGVLGGGATYTQFLRNEESQQPCPDDFFTVADSPGKGNGLFATRAIEQGTFLFDCDCWRGLEDCPALGCCAL